MPKELAKCKQSQQKIHLPHILHSKSVPIVPHKKEEFTLRFTNQQMPHYQPSKDRFLNDYFGKQGKRSQEGRSQKSAKTLPSEEGRAVRARPLRQKLLTLESQKLVGDSREGRVQQLSKQQFGSFLQMMRDKLAIK